MVQIEKKYQDEKVTPDGFRYYVDPTFRPEWHVTANGTVVALPGNLKETDLGTYYTKIEQDIEPGDDIAFGYNVIRDFRVHNDSECFMEISNPNALDKIFQNGKKEVIKTQKFSKHLYAAVWITHTGVLIAGFQGTYKELGRWLSKFRYVSDTDVIYKNQLWVDEQDFWLVDFMEILAVKRNDEIIMLAGNVLLEKQNEEQVYKVGPGRQLYLVTKVDEGRSKVVSIGKNLKDEPDIGVKAGDIVRFDQRIIQKYELWGENYLIVQQSQILGIEND